MIRHVHREFTVPTRGIGLVEITGEARALVTGSGLRTGLLTVLVRHPSVSLLIQEAGEPIVEMSLIAELARLVPEGERISDLRIGRPEGLPPPLRAALKRPSLLIPISVGELGLGPAQGIYLLEQRHAPHLRRVMMHAFGG